MLTIEIPDQIAIPLAEEAARQGTTPELLAIDAVRRAIPHTSPTKTSGGTLFDALKPFIGAVDGSSEPFSQDCGEKFAEGLATGQPARP